MPNAVKIAQGVTSPHIAKVTTHRGIDEVVNIAVLQLLQEVLQYF